MYLFDCFKILISTSAQLHYSDIDISSFPFRKHIRLPVKIVNNVWISSGAIINAGVIIDDNIVLGANSVVLI
ncbi:MAG: hypothetical protein K8R58_15165 [Bacteroidales bacterium]|nr:hypothetical protein [Bacteroidales bacterium]